MTASTDRRPGDGDARRGRVAVVTGGPSGFGLALAEHAAARGFDVGLLDIDGDRVGEAAATLAATHGVGAVGRRVDVASTEDVEAAAADLGAQFGRCDLLWVNVGVQHFGASRPCPTTSGAGCSTST